jgi:hypothetical protein
MNDTADELVNSVCDGLDDISADDDERNFDF